MLPLIGEMTSVWLDQTRYCFCSTFEFSPFAFGLKQNPTDILQRVQLTFCSKLVYD